MAGILLILNAESFDHLPLLARIFGARDVSKAGCQFDLETKHTQTSTNNPRRQIQNNAIKSRNRILDLSFLKTMRFAILFLGRTWIFVFRLFRPMLKLFSTAASTCLSSIRNISFEQTVTTIALRPQLFDLLLRRTRILNANRNTNNGTQCFATSPRKERRFIPVT